MHGGRPGNGPSPFFDVSIRSVLVPVLRGIPASIAGFFVFLLLLNPGAVRAEAAAWQARAAGLQLASDPQWLALLHYEPVPRMGQRRSFVDDRKFFLSPHGATDPVLELSATLEAFFDDTSARCRFHARRQWLESQLPGLAAELPAVSCPEYEEWRTTLGAHEVWLVFASSYLNSPSSMYGHTFFRFDSAHPERRSPLLSYAVNFGANIPPDENGFVYAYRGLFGGYPGLFAGGPYFEKLREYSRLENRDLWEYRLDLDAAEIDRLLAHIWELRDIRFDYYFFDENCSLRLLELLEIARPGTNLAGRFPVYAIPIDTVRAVIDGGMVNAVEYRPANLTRFRFEARSLAGDERRLVTELVEAAELPDLHHLELQRRRAVVSAAYDLLQYRSVHEPHTPALLERNFVLLRLLNEVSVGDNPAAVKPQRPSPPHEGHRTALVALGGGVEESRAVTDLEFRLSYHDLLDAPGGYPSGASLNMARVVVRHREGGTLQLQRVDALEITSLSPRDRFFQPWSWRVNAGLDRQWTDGDDVLVPQVNAGVGWAWAPQPALGFHLLVTGRIEHNHDMARELDVAPGLAAGLRLSGRRGVTLLGVDHYVFTDGVDRTVLGISHDWSLRPDFSLRFHVGRSVTDSDRIDEVLIGLRRYF